MGESIHLLSSGELVCWTLIVTGGLALFAIIALGKRTWGVPGSLQNVAESVVEFLLNMFEPEFGKDLMPLLLPIIGAFFLFILISNTFLLIPFTHCPTGDLSTTAALAFVSIVGIHILSIKLKGPKKYLKDWINPYPELSEKAESEENAGFFKKLSGFLYLSLMKIIVCLLIFLHVMDNAARLLSLSFRLFGNIFGEHTVYAMVSQLATGTWQMVIPLFIPLLILIIDILVTIIQTVVFCMLVAFYLKEEAAIHT
jgi:F-type H+-transporting ATPase subunit a